MRRRHIELVVYALIVAALTISAVVIVRGGQGKTPVRVNCFSAGSLIVTSTAENWFFNSGGWFTFTDAQTHRTSRVKADCIITEVK